MQEPFEVQHSFDTQQLPNEQSVFTDTMPGESELLQYQ